MSDKNDNPEQSAPPAPPAPPAKPEIPEADHKPEESNPEASRKGPVCLWCIDPIDEDTDLV